MTESLKELVLAEARAAGFDAARVTTPAAVGSAVAERLSHFLQEGRHGDMAWLATTAERRRHPLGMWPQARSIVMLGLNYAPKEDPLVALTEPSRGAISCYAQCKDYHDVVKSGLKRVAGALARESGAEVKVFVDTAPLMEKPLGEAAGLGWQGKHTNLVSREFGSWLFLGAILTSAELEPDAPEADHCGTCQRCIDICPTNAFPAPYQLDARRCIAYLTIEHKGHIPAEFREAIGNRVFGCDDCLAVCPWNKFAAAARETRLQALEGASAPPLEDLLALDDPAFRQRFAGTPVKRTGRDRVMRNALIAAGNSRNRGLIPAVERLLGDASPLVRAMAVWALQRLVQADAWEGARARHVSHETDAAVLAEWGAEAR
ncbi:MAG: tRNA epoxyqueuosine(34) reductase QueG [Hyphomonadaceae bacterium]|jgi:epoxyqueuosine reductase|nr:tRNA epoxyqueuosine(34) reductase QueG [Hyphomonadaceae bacterium]